MKVVSSVVESFPDFPYTDSNVPIVEDEVVEEDSPWDLRDLTFKDYRGPSALLRIQEYCRISCLSVPSDVLSFQGLIKHALTAFIHVDETETSLLELKKSRAVETTDLEKSLGESEERLRDAKRRIQEFEHSRDILQYL